MNDRERTGVLLEELMKGINYNLRSGKTESISISSVSADSREVRPGSLFVAIQGDTTDGHEFINNALSAGASAVLVNNENGWSVLTAAK